MFLPGVLTRQTVTVEARTGEGAYGPVYAAPRTVECRRDEQRRLVRGPDGQEVVSEATVWTRAGEQVGAGDRVTLSDGRQATVLVSKRHQGLSAPMAREVVLV